MSSGSQRITVLGREISVKTAADEKMVRKVESFVNERIKHEKKADSSSDSFLAITLTLLNIAGDYLAVLDKQRKKQDAENDRVAALLQRLKSATE